MANFRIIPGMFIKVIKTIGPLKEGDVLQIIHGATDFMRIITFVSVNFYLPLKHCGQYISPIYPEKH